MAATAFDNVISLRPGGSLPAAAAKRVLAECRDLAARRLREALREMLEKVCEDFLHRGDVADGRDERNFFYGLKDGLVAKGSRLDAQLAAHWAREFDVALKGALAATLGQLNLDELQLVEHGEVDEELAFKSMARRLHDRNEEELYALGRRLAALAGRENAAEAENPAAPEVLSRALRGALRDTDFDQRSRVVLCHSLEGYLVDHIGPIYHALNAHLLRHNILPNLRRSYGRGAGHVPTKEAGRDGDVFAILQRLVSGINAAAPATGSAVGGMAVRPGPAAAGAALPAGVAMPAGTSLPAQIVGGAVGAGGTTVPAAHVWASLDALQHAVPVFVAGQAMAADNANVLREFRASEVGQGLGQLDAITVDIVAMLFDMIFDDRDISDPIKALVGKLQIPVLKVAMLDKSFFSSKSHPTRRLLDVISRAALRWGKQIGHDDPIYRKIAEVIDRIHADFKQDTALFDAICDDLERFLAEHEDAADAHAARAARLVVQRELEELAGIAADAELRLWLDGSLPRPVADLLDHEWRELLRRTHLEDGPDSEAWKNALKTANELVDSARPERDIHERQALARQLPTLVKQLNQGFDRIGVDGDRRHALFDALFSLHAAVLRGTEPPPSVVAEAKPAPDAALAEPGLASDELADGEVTVESISVTTPLTAAVASRDVEDLQRGDWVEFIQPDASAVRHRLSWVSPQRGILLFTNPQSSRALAVSPEAMSLQLQRGEARIVPTEPIFDRAMTRAIDVLQAA